MKPSLLFLFLISSYLISAQNTSIEAGLFIAGNYKDKGRSVRKTLYLAPEMTFSLPKGHQLGLGLIYERQIYNYPQAAYIPMQGGYNRYFASEDRTLGVKVIGRRLVSLASDRWKLIIGFDLVGMKSEGSRSEIDVPGSEVDELSYSVGFRHYGGIRFQLNPKFTLNSYIDLFQFSYDMLRAPSKDNSISSGPLIDPTHGFSFIKIGFTYKL